MIAKGGSDYYRGFSRSRKRMLAANLKVQARELHAPGTPVPKIARMLHRSVRHMRNLLKGKP